MNIYEWDRAIIPPMNICPELYCFFFTDCDIRNGKVIRIKGRCDEAFKHFDGNLDCIRRPNFQSPARDWYEPCNPVLEREGLPNDYFINKIL
jgi:hypothetical protein